MDETRAPVRHDKACMNKVARMSQPPAREQIARSISTCRIFQ
jgi:hypothetical protein